MDFRMPRPRRMRLQFTRANLSRTLIVPFIAVVIATTSVDSVATRRAPLSAVPRCPASPVHYERLPDAEAGLGALPWVAPTPRGSGLVGHLFYYDAFPSVPWGKRQMRGFRIFSGGRAPDNRVNMKILWSAPAPLSGKRLVIRGSRIDQPEEFIQRLSVGPSIVLVPHPGCWRLTLAVGNVVTRLTVIAERGYVRK